MNSAASSRRTCAPIAVSVVLVTETHGGVLAAHQSVVGNGHAVGVAAQIVEDLLGPCEGALGVEHPGGFVVERIGKQTSAGRWRLAERRVRCGRVLSVKPVLNSRFSET